MEKEYRFLAEPTEWYEAYLRYNAVFHSTPGESAYVYTAIFAPTGLKATVFHEWQRYAEGAGEWTTEEIIPFYIVGGRDGGYRGYSIKSGIASGKWRVNVVTEFGQLIGRVAFDVVEVPEPVPVQVVVR